MACVIIIGMTDEKNVAERITELQTRCTELENERRMWKSRASSFCTLLEATLIDIPIGFQHALEMQSETRDVARIIEVALDDALKKIALVSHRADALEADAWCKAVGVARDFVSACDKLPIDGDDLKSDWIRRWRDTFKSALK